MVFCPSICKWTKNVCLCRPVGDTLINLFLTFTDERIVENKRGVNRCYTNLSLFQILGDAEGKDDSFSGGDVPSMILS
jgi:hypothetical protein